jgi:Putative Flp pilus-assembly TadE/G-like
MRAELQTGRRAGAVLPLVTICLVGLMAFVALSIDIGMMAVARTQAQATADISALSGARTLDGTPGNNKANAELEAREAAKANYILAVQINDAQIAPGYPKTGVYKYNASAQRFEADFVNGPTGLESYGAMQMRIVTNQDTYFGKVLGVNSMLVAAEATAVHRPRDIAISLDFSGSMKFSSEFNYPPISGTLDVSGSLNPDDRFPRFGPWKIYALATVGNPNPMQRLDPYVDSGGEAHAMNNLTTETIHGPAVVQNFQTTAANGGPNAFVYNGDLTAGAFDISHTPVSTPTPASWTSQYATGYAGDRWPLKSGLGTTSPTVTDYAKTAAEILGILTVLPSTRSAAWELDGYDSAGLLWKNGTFKGHVMGPGYFGKSFYIWPPDPRYTAGADPTNINTSNPIQDTSGRFIADWRKRFFLYPSTSAAAKGAVLDDNSRLFNPTGTTPVGQWKSQNAGGNPVNYVPNYDAILKWIKSGPQTLPPSLRAGRVLYYDAIPDAIPMNWQTGLIASSATTNERFWKDYIDFVLGAGRHNRFKTLNGSSTNNTWAGSTFGTPKITPLASLTGTPRPYMAYDDIPVHPKAHMWFGPLTMMGFLSINSDNLDYNWYAGTTYEAHTWQLKAGIRGALDDIKKNHPNDLATMNMWSSHNGYNVPRAPMGKLYDTMKNALYYPFSLVNSLGTMTSEKRPYKNNSTISSGNPSGLDPFNYQADVPLGDGGTCPSMGLMLSYNEFNWTGSYTGRKGALKMVILETDGVANQTINGTLGNITGGGKQWTSITNGGSAPSPSNGHPAALDPALTLAWLICQDSAGSKPWPTLAAYTNAPGLATAGVPAKWSGVPNGAPGYSTIRNPARVHALAFGQLFEASTTSNLKIRAFEFLRNMQIVGQTLPPGSTAIEPFKIITGTYTERVAKIKEAMERIMQGGVQVALIE